MPGGVNQTITVALTYPPSANRLWRAVNGRQIKSEAYRTWLEWNLALARARRDSPQTITGPYSMEVLATAPDKRRRDLDNLLKPVGDMLQHLGLVSDDANCRSLSAAWEVAGQPGLRVILSPMRAA